MYVCKINEYNTAPIQFGQLFISACPLFSGKHIPRTYLIAAMAGPSCVIREYSRG